MFEQVVPSKRNSASVDPSGRGVSVSRSAAQRMVELGGRKGASQWTVKDGAMVGTGQASMLYSPKGYYQNFKFRAEIKKVAAEK